MRGNNWEIDPERLYEYLTKYKNVKQVFLFAGEDDHPKSREFLEDCRRIGYTVVTKKVKYVQTAVQSSPFWETIKEYVPAEKLDELKNDPIMRRKCDFDVEISKELLLNIEDYHTFILFSGDGDYAPVIEEVMEREKRVFIVSTLHSLGREIREMADNKVHPIFVDVFSLKEVIQRRGGRRRGGNFRRKQQPGLIRKVLAFFGR
jgi:uncharacterized LabA/DUF88 family protein